MADVFSILVATADEKILWSALSLAAAQAARGKTVSLFLSGYAAGVARPDFVASTDAHHNALGVATLQALFASCAELTVEIHVCQTGMALCALTADSLRAGATPAGLISWLAQVDAPDAIF